MECPVNPQGRLLTGVSSSITHGHQCRTMREDREFTWDSLFSPSELLHSHGFRHPLFADIYRVFTLVHVSLVYPIVYLTTHLNVEDAAA